MRSRQYPDGTQARKDKKSPLFHNWTVSLGPGLVYILTALGAGDIVSNATAGATFGYQLIWALGMTLIFRFVWVNTSAKYVLVTGESLFTGYGRLGHSVVWVILISLLPLRHLYNLYVILIIGSSADLLFHLPTQWSAQIWTCFFTFVGFAMMFWGGYPVVESFCKFLVGGMGASLLLAALLSKPDPAAILQGTFIATLPQAQGLYSAVLIVMALIGAEVGSTANLTYPYFIIEKGWKNASYLKRQRFDLAFAIGCMFVMGGLLQIAAAGTIHPLGLDVKDANDLARIFSETQGVVGWAIFCLGLWGASFSTFVGANIGSALIVTDVCRTFVPGLKRSVEREKERYTTKNDPIYRWTIIFWSFSPLYIIFTGVSPVWLVLTVSAFTVVLIPILVISLLLITNDKSLMGKYKNGWFTNSVMMLLVFIVLYFTYVNLLDWWGSLVST